MRPGDRVHDIAADGIPVDEAPRVEILPVSALGIFDTLYAALKAARS